MTKAQLNNQNIAVVAGIITVFNYDVTTREYISSSEEYLAVGVGIPAHSCIDAPGDAKNGYTLCRTSGLSQWEYIADHRGETVYSIGTGEKVAISAPGNYPEGTTTQEPATKYDIWSGDQWVTDTLALREAETAQAEAQRSLLLNQANTQIAWRLDAVDAGIATNEEKAALAEWKKYRVLLMRVNTAAPVWPTPPAQ